jgi:hypothetical protein
MSFRDEWWARQVRCPSVSLDGLRCGLEKGHDGEHSALIETGAPWENDGVKLLPAVKKPRKKKDGAS